MKLKKTLLVALPLLVAITSLTGCNKKGGGNNKGTPSFSGIEGWDPVLEYEGDLDVFMYIYGLEGRWMDAGNPKHVAEDIVDGSQALFFAAAREFKKIYPKIRINVISGNGTGYSPSFYDNFADYIDSHGQRPPHIMHHVDPIPTLLSAGYVADIGQYTDKMPLYNYINPDLLKYYNYGGFQGAVPYGIFPYGLFVNKKSIEKRFLELPEPTDADWTLDKLDEIISSTPTNTNDLAGLVNLNYEMVNFMAPTIYRNYIDGKPVDLNTPEIEKILTLENKWVKDYVWFDATMSGGGKHPNNTVWNGWEKTALMASGSALVQLDNPFAIGGLSSFAEKENTVDDLDIYPFPSLDSEGENTLGLLMGALSIGNQCPLDSNNQEVCTKKQRLSQEAAAYFATFMVSDPRSIKAASEIKWKRSNESDDIVTGAIKGLPILREKDENNEAYSLPSSVKGVTDEYQTQLQYFFDAYPAFTNEKPGMARVMEMYNEGKGIICNSNTYPMTVPSEVGGTKQVMANWNGRYGQPGDGVVVSSVTWVDQMRSKLADMTAEINSLTETSWNFLEENMRANYILPSDWDPTEKKV